MTSDIPLPLDSKILKTDDARPASTLKSTTFCHRASLVSDNEGAQKQGFIGSRVHGIIKREKS